MPEIRDFLLTITGWGESGKLILQVSVAVFSGAAEKFFGRRKFFSGTDVPAPLEKICPYAYEKKICHHPRVAGSGESVVNTSLNVFMDHMYTLFET